MGLWYNVCRLHKWSTDTSKYKILNVVLFMENVRISFYNSYFTLFF